MLFFRQDPPGHLAHLVRQFWIVENSDPTPVLQKVIPDGYDEIIFHYGDPYRIQLYETWELQDRMLFSGQIRHHFNIENTGTSGILGIKLMPAAPYALFQRDMSTLTDRVAPLSLVTDLLTPDSLFAREMDPEYRINIATTWLEKIDANFESDEVIRISGIVNEIVAQNGMTNIESLASMSNISRRHLEREFKKVIGLTPKYFARIIQFNFIFEAMQAKDNSWVDVALDSGYFDQSHFIRNFKAFTGESPSQYGFDAKNLANFFLKKG